MRCTAHKQDGSPCRAWAMKGCPVCRVHGGTASQVKEAAQQRLRAEKARAELARLMKNAGDMPSVIPDPETGLETLINGQAMVVLRLQEIFWALADDDLRYRGKTGEQTHGIATLLLMAMRDLKSSLEAGIRAGLAQRHALLAEQRVDQMERALSAALMASGLTPEGQEKARLALVRELERGESEAS